MRKFIIIFLFLTTFMKAEDIILSISSGFPVPETNLVRTIVQDGFNRANITTKYQTVPPERSLVNVNLGLDDVEAGRIKGIESTYPNLIRITVQIHTIDIVLLSKKKIKVDEVSDLKRYHLGLNRGVKIAESIAKKSGSESITMATSYNMLIKMLINDRIDVIITSKIGMLTMLADTENEGLFLTLKPVVSLPLYTYVNKKYKHLVPKITKAYQSMDKDGTIEKYHNGFLHDLEVKIENKVKIIND